MPRRRRTVPSTPTPQPRPTIRQGDAKRIAGRLLRGANANEIELDRKTREFCVELIAGQYAVSRRMRDRCTDLWLALGRPKVGLVKARSYARDEFLDAMVTPRVESTP